MTDPEKGKKCEKLKLKHRFRFNEALKNDSVLIRVRIRSLANAKAFFTHSRSELNFPTVLFTVHTLLLCSSISNYNT